MIMMAVVALLMIHTNFVSMLCAAGTRCVCIDQHTHHVFDNSTHTMIDSTCVLVVVCPLDDTLQTCCNCFPPLVFRNERHLMSTQTHNSLSGTQQVHTSSGQLPVKLSQLQQIDAHCQLQYVIGEDHT